MRTDNRKVKNSVVSIYFILIAVAVLSAIIFKFSDYLSGKILYIFLGLFIVVLLFHFVSRFFEYDSDGVKIVIINRGLLLTDYINYRENKVEFTRNQLIGFKIRNYALYKSLVILVKKNDGRRVKERFNVTFLKNKKLSYVRQSLSKIVKENRKRKEG